MWKTLREFLLCGEGVKPTRQYTREEKSENDLSTYLNQKRTSLFSLPPTQEITTDPITIRKILIRSFSILNKCQFPLVHVSPWMLQMKMQKNCRRSDIRNYKNSRKRLFIMIVWGARASRWCTLQLTENHVLLPLGTAPILWTLSLYLEFTFTIHWIFF